MKKITVLLCLLLSFASLGGLCYALAEGAPSPGIEAVFPPALRNLSDESVATDASFDELVAQNLVDGQLDVNSFASSLMYSRYVTDTAPYDTRFEQERDGHPIYILITGTTIQTVFTNGNGDTVVMQINANSSQFTPELIAKVLYFFATATNLDVREVPVDLPIQYFVYASQEIPQNANGDIELSKLNPLNLVNFGFVN
ncbi:hypothetical protein IJH29_00935 [Candidatus Saccharibacteria bacterium]|nr:hypothetical protein [Candidatus Saccharibacteria bacterium]